MVKEIARVFNNLSIYVIEKNIIINMRDVTSDIAMIMYYYPDYYTCGFYVGKLLKTTFQTIIRKL